MALTGWILAGGESRRMGSNKALLTLGVDSFAALAVKQLKPLAKHIVVIGNTENRGQLENLPVDYVTTDIRAGKGPLMGIFTGLMTTETPWNLFLACDMPFIETPLLKDLVRFGQSRQAGAACSQAGGRLHPLPMLCHSRLAGLAGRLLDKGSWSLREFISAASGEIYAVDGRHLSQQLISVNTHADYAALCTEIAA